MKKLLLLAPLLLAQPANADFGKEFYEKRGHVILDHLKAAREARESRKYDWMCIQYYEAAHQIDAILPSLQKYFPDSPWVGLRWAAQDTFTEYGCEARSEYRLKL